MAISLPTDEFPNLSLDRARLPRHVAIVMDGNGRWAQRRGLSRNEGHRRGKDSVRAVVETARELGIPYLSLFAFSHENWGRPSTEVNFLMRLFHRYLITEGKRLMKRDIRVLALGESDAALAAVAPRARADGRADREESGDDAGARAPIQRAAGYHLGGAQDRRRGRGGNT